MFWTTLDSILDSFRVRVRVPEIPPRNFRGTCRRTLFFAREEGKQREREWRPPSSIETETGTHHKKNTMLYDPNR